MTEAEKALLEAVVACDWLFSQAIDLSERHRILDLRCAVIRERLEHEHPDWRERYIEQQANMHRFYAEFSPLSNAIRLAFGIDEIKKLEEEAIRRSKEQK